MRGLSDRQTDTGLALASLRDFDRQLLFFKLSELAEPAIAAVHQLAAGQRSQFPQLTADRALE